MNENLLQRLVTNLAPGGRLLHSWRLSGGVSARVTVIEIGFPQGQIKRLLLRQHGQADLRQNPQIARTEYELLRLLHSLGLPVSQPYAVLAADEYLATPALVLEYVAGKTEMAPTNPEPLAEQMAQQLLCVHAVPTAELDFLPQQTTRTNNWLSAQKADAAPDAGAADALHILRSSGWPTAANQPTLLHGDYWPGNILWRDRQLAAIIDWEDTTVGEPLSDLANSRLELALAYGAGAVQAFTTFYQASSSQLNYSDLPYWDLWAALRLEQKIPGWGLELPEEREMLQSVRLFREQALQELA